MNSIEIDARGLSCPMPVIRLAAAARDAPAGTRIIVLASDPAARHDIPAWCRMRGHEMSEISEISEMSEMSEMSATDTPSADAAHRTYLRFVVLVLPQSSKAAGTGSGSERWSRAM